MPFSGPMEDRLAIRELYDTYGDASTRGDLELFLSCWDEDGVWNTQLFTRTGKDEMREQWAMLWTNFEKVAFLANVLSIEVEGDTASCRALQREEVLLKSGGIYRLSGLYSDRLIRSDGQWHFKRRDYEVLIEEVPG